MAVKRETRIIMAYLLDRVEQFQSGSGYYAFVGDLVGALADGEHLASWRAGELDDLTERVESIIRKRPKREAPASGGAGK